MLYFIVGFLVGAGCMGIADFTIEYLKKQKERADLMQAEIEALHKAVVGEYENTDIEED